MAFKPDTFWSAFEQTVSSYSELEAIIQRITEFLPSECLIAWRGQRDASWALHSSLYRRLCWTKPSKTQEEDLYRVEGQILTDTHRWGLHMTRGLGRLSILNQLAALQHYGTPTRLIDVTFNPLIGAWFAVEEKWNNGTATPDKDGRIFAIDVTERLINETHLRNWADNLRRPWRIAQKKRSDNNENDDYCPDFAKDWHSGVYAWRPSHFEARIAAQNGGFIFGGIPKSTHIPGGNIWFKKPGMNEKWLIGEVRKATCLTLRPHVLSASRGRKSTGSVFTIRIKAAAKQEIRKKLQLLFGYEPRTIYPDFMGFADYGARTLRSGP